MKIIFKNEREKERLIKMFAETWKNALEQAKVETISKTENVQKEKVTSAEIINCEVERRAYYLIKFKKVDENDYTFGYGSFKLGYVVKWLNDCFEFCGEAKVYSYNNDWISVEERLPEESGYYLVQLSKRLENEDWADRVVVVYDGEAKEFMCYKSLIIAWQPLPEPYKPKETLAAGMEHIMSRFTKVE